MANLTEEVRIWNTPLVGGFMLWRFTQGYMEGHASGEAPSAILHFIASALFTNEKLLNLISDSRPNLQSYIRSFEDFKDSDVLLNIQERTKDKLMYTWQSIDIAIASGLLVWDTNNGKVYSRKLEEPVKKGFGLKPVHARNGNKAHILGKWFSQHDIQTIATYFKVVL